MSEKEQPAYIFKICLLGQGAVGKTCICRRLCYDTFDFNTKLTIGIDFYTYHQPLIINGEETYVTMSIWDFGGQEQFKSMFNYYINGANGLFLIFSMIRMATLINLNWWNKQLKKFGQKDTPKILIGAKSDLIEEESKNFVNDLVIKRFMKRQNLELYYKTSAKENENIKLIFKETARSILDKNYLLYDKLL